MNDSSQSTKQRKRSLVFWFFVVVSIPLITFVVGYASGYRFDTHSKKLSITSLISVDTVPAGATVFLNGVVQKKVTPFTQSVLPGEYTIRIARDGYQQWTRTIQVTEGQSALLPNVLLLAQTPTLHEKQDAPQKPIELRLLTTEEQLRYSNQGFTNTDAFLLLDSGPQIVLVDPLRDTTWLLPADGTADTASYLGTAATVAEWNSDKSQLLFMNDSELWIYAIAKATPILLRRQSAPLIDATWSADSSYIFYSDGDSIGAVETGTTNNRQQWTMAKVAHAAALFMQKKELLFTASDKTYADELIP